MLTPIIFHLQLSGIQMLCPKCAQSIEPPDATECSNCGVVISKIILACPRCRHVAKGFEIQKPGICPECGANVMQFLAREINTRPDSSEAVGIESQEKEPPFVERLKGKWSRKEKTIAAIVGFVIAFFALRLGGAFGFGLIFMTPLLLMFFSNKEHEQTLLPTTICSACNGIVAWEAKTCPHCGGKNPAPKPPTKVTKRHLALASAALGIFIILSIVGGQTPSSSSASSSAPEQKKAIEETIATMLNLNGYLCASVQSVKPLQIQDQYEVTCISYRGGAATKSYVFNAKTGKAFEQ